MIFYAVSLQDTDNLSQAEADKADCNGAAQYTVHHRSMVHYTVHSDIADYHMKHRPAVLDTAENSARADHRNNGDARADRCTAVPRIELDSVLADRHTEDDSAELSSAVSEAAERSALRGEYIWYWYSDCLNYFCRTYYTPFKAILRGEHYLFFEPAARQVKTVHIRLYSIIAVADIYM